jgi:predicted RNA-binding protein with RPS1 domain
MPAEESTHRRLPLPFAMVLEDEIRKEMEPEPELPAEERNYCRLPLPFGMMSVDEFRKETETEPELPAEERNYRRLPLPFAMMSEDELRTEVEPEPESMGLVGIADLSYKGVDQHYSPSEHKASDPAGHQPCGEYLRSVGSEQGKNSLAPSGAALPRKWRTKRTKEGWGSVSNPGLTYDRNHGRFTIGGYTVQDKSNALRRVQSAAILAHQNSAAWETVQALAEKNESLEAPVIGVNRGGVVCLVHGIRAFLPGRHLTGPLADDDLIGKILPLKIIEIDSKTDKLVVSNRKAVVDQQKSAFSHGDLVSGTVNSVQSHAAFVEVGGMSGLLHITQISYDRIDDLKKVLHVGMKVKCMVLDHDKVIGRITLSTKPLEPEPGDMLKDPDAVFAKAEATVAAYYGSYAWRQGREAAARDIVLGYSLDDSSGGNADYKSSHVADPDSLLSLPILPRPKSRQRRTNRALRWRDRPGM